MSQEQEQEQKQGQAKADMQAPEKGPIRRFIGNKWVKRLLWILFICYFLFSCAKQCGHEKTASDYADIAALEMAVHRAVFMNEGEYQIAPTVDKWYKLGNRPFIGYDVNFCKLNQNGELYAPLPDGREAQAMIFNCKLVETRLCEHSPFREWLRFFLPFLEKILPFQTRYLAYIPAEYLADEALFNRIVSALQNPCKYAFIGQLKEMNSFDVCPHRFCRRYSPIDIELRILKPGTKKFSPDAEYIFSKKITTLP